jgi:hypothetical protein
MIGTPPDPELLGSSGEGKNIPHLLVRLEQIFAHSRLHAFRPVLGEADQQSLASRLTRNSGQYKPSH